MKTILGIIGGFVGGLIASIPWIIGSVYFNIMWSLLAIPIGFGVAMGYDMSGGKKDLRYPLIIAVVSLLVVTVVSLVIEPLVYVHKEYGIILGFDILIQFYSDSAIRSNAFKELLGSIVFAAIGLSGIIRNTISEALSSKKPEFTENANDGIERQNNENDEKI